MTVYAQITLSGASLSYNTYVESDSIEELNAGLDAVRNAIERQYTIRINYPNDDSLFINTLNISLADIRINVPQPSNPSLIGKLDLASLIRG